MISSISELALVVALSHAIMHFDLANPKYAFAISVGFGGVQALLLVVLAYIRSCILKNNGSFKLVIPPRPFRNKKPRIFHIPIQDYDMPMLNKVLERTVIC